MIPTDLLSDVALGAGTTRWQTAHLAAALRKSLTELDAARVNTGVCGWCGGRLMKVYVNQKNAWAHEALGEGEKCRLTSRT